MMDINERAKEVHTANVKWWHDLETGEPLNRNVGELQMLIVSELSEAMEGERKDLMDDHIPHRKMAEVEMADAYIRVLDYQYGLYGHFWAYTGEVPDVPENKGEALFALVKLVAQFDNGIEMVGKQTAKLLAGIEAYCRKFCYDLEGAYQEKMAYNAVRADHQAEQRRLAGGKKW